MKERLKAIRKRVKSFMCRNLYDWIPRRLTEFEAVCDICGRPVSWHDYGYMCRKCGDVYWKTKWRLSPKFLFKLIRKFKKEDIIC